MFVFYIIYGNFAEFWQKRPYSPDCVCAPLDFFAAGIYNRHMYKIFRIASSIIAALCAAAAVFVFVFLGMAWGFICVAGAIVFFLLTLTFKRLQERQELKDNPPPPEGDFITGRVPSGDATDGDRDEKHHTAKACRRAVDGPLTQLNPFLMERASRPIRAAACIL